MQDNIKLTKIMTLITLSDLVTDSIFGTSHIVLVFLIYSITTIFLIDFIIQFIKKGEK